MIRKLPEPYRNGHPLNIASRCIVSRQGDAGNLLTRYAASHGRSSRQQVMT